MYQIRDRFLFKIFVIFLFPLLFSCSSSENIDEVDALSLGKTYKANILSVGTETQFFNPRKILNVNNEYLIFVDDVDEGVFKVFGLPDLEFKYTWGRMGRGPDELSFISLRQINSYKNNLVFYEDVYARLRFYQVTDSALVLSREQDDFSFREKRNPINGLKILNDSLYVINLGFGDLGDKELQKEFIGLRPEKQEPAFTFGFYPDQDLEPVERMQEYSKITAAKPDGSKFVSFYRNYNKFKIFDDEGTLLKELNVNDPILNNEDKHRFIYRIATKATNKYIYTLAVNNTEEALQQSPDSFKPSIEVWNWDGEPVKRFKLNHPTPRFTVSEKYGKLYGYPLSLENLIYEYDLKEIMKSK